MQKLFIEEGRRTPAIMLSSDDKLFYIKGASFPEDVRQMYYPVIDWIKKFTEKIKSGKCKIFNKDNPIYFQMDLSYFNSSSAKFFYDIFYELKQLESEGIPVIVEWFYEENDPDMKDAGSDFSEMLEMEFVFTAKKE
jgi:hypothetical protein